MNPELFAQELHALFTEAGLPSKLDAMVVTLNPSKTRDYSREVVFRIDAQFAGHSSRNPEMLCIGLPDDCNDVIYVKTK